MRRLIVLVVLVVCALMLIGARADAATDRSARHLRSTVHPCLAAIVDRENTTWNPTAYNRQGSGAYGLPQALPGSKMASAGADWRTNPRTQLKWMLSYVNARYGSACAAWEFWKRNRWY